MDKHKGMITSYVAMVICIFMGLNKMFIYENSDLSFVPSKNAYVGGDAYNYIINAGYSTAWFVLAGVCAILGLTFFIAKHLEDRQNNEQEIINQNVIATGSGEN